MGFMDNFLDRMKLRGEPEEDYDEYDEDVEDDEEVPDTRIRRKDKPISVATEDEDEEDDEPAKPARPFKASRVPKSPARSNSTTKIVKMGATNMAVCVIKPTTVDEEREIADTLLSGRAVIINLEGIEVDQAQRIIDFMSGACFAIKGNLQSVSKYIFIATPDTIEVSGDFLGNISADGSFAQELKF